MGNGLYRASLDITSIDAHHETSAELSKPPGHDGRCHVAVPPTSAQEHLQPRGGETVNTAPYMGVGSYLAIFEIRSIKARLETPSELSNSSGGDEVTLRSTPPAHPFGSENGGVNVTFTAR